MKTVLLFAMAIIINFSATCQTEFEDGYALKGNDSIKCKLIADERNDFPKASVKLLIDGEEATFFAGGPITGFGATDATKNFHYGVLDVDQNVADRKIGTVAYIKKIAAGRVDLYEHSYTVRTTKRKTVNGVEQPGTTTTSQTISNYYIAKKDSLHYELSSAKHLRSFRASDLKHYFSDQPELFSNAGKRFSVKELVAFVKEYNSRYSKNK